MAKKTNKKKDGSIKIEPTCRGFARGEFADRNGVKCSIQKSSIATEACIWLGCNAPEPMILIPGQGWVPYQMPDSVLCNTRMHLSKKQVKKLLPILTKFVETGDI